MKKFLCVLLITVIGATVAYAQQNVTLTFTAQDANNHYVQLNRIAITNLTKGWQEIIYWPDTTLTMQNGTGIDDVELAYKGNSTIQLSQNNPNPFSSTTDVNLMLVEEGDVILQISDMYGKIVKKIHKSSLPLGTHQFQVYIATAGTYIMTAQQNGKFSTIKMVCTVGGNKDGISYMGIIGANDYSPKSGSRSNTTQPFNFGDMMEYVGYATINGSEIESQRIMQAQNVSQTYTLQFTETQYQLPVVATETVSDISSSSALVTGRVISIGGTFLYRKGVCWSTSPDPTLNNSFTVDSNGLGSFNSLITGLQPNTHYFVRAYATNSEGTAYGTQQSLYTLNTHDGQACSASPTITDYDGNIYNTVQIGQQCWIKENLRTRHYANGDSILLGSSSSDNVGYCYFPNNDSSNVSIYGYLYNWKAVMGNSSSSATNPSGIQGICPDNWHVPSDAEWTQLTTYVSNQSQYVCGDNNTYIARALADTINWNTSSNTCSVGLELSSNNATGFSVLPAGYHAFGGYHDFGSYAYFWSVTECYYFDTYSRSLRHNYAYVNRNATSRSGGLSVRCIRD